MEGGYNADHNDRDQARIMKMLLIAKNGTLAESAVALTALEVEYPTVLRHYEKEQARRKLGLLASLKASQAKEGERLSDQPIKEVFAGTARGVKERATRAKESKDPIGEFFSDQKKKVAEFKAKKDAKETLRNQLADTETERLRKEAQTKRDSLGQFQKKEE